MIEIAGRLIREDDAGAVHHRPRDADALLLAARELQGVVVPLLEEPHEIEGCHRSLPDLLRGPAADYKRQGHIVIDRAAVDEAVVLENHADAAAVELHAALGEPSEADVVNHDAAHAGALHEVDELQERALARSRAAAEIDHLAVLKAERDVLQSLLACVVALAYFLKEYHLLPPSNSASMNSPALNSRRSLMPSPTPM